MSSLQSADSPLGRPLDEVSNIQPFQYASLPTSTSIRLIEILPSNEDVIRCRMTTVDLDDQPRSLRYVCLSYTWGSPTTIIEEPAPEPEEYTKPEDFTRLPYVFESKGPDGLTMYNADFAMKYYIERHPWIPRTRVDKGPPKRLPIQLDGAMVYVQENLHFFLKAYVSWRRWYHSKRGTAEAQDTDEEIFMMPMWIDAICINQDDPDERACQVQLMGSIFRGARRILAWLGPPDGFTSNAMEGLGMLYSSDLSSQTKQGITLSDIPGMDLVNWFAVFAFFQRSWFRRAWVTQEAAFGRQRVIVMHGGCLLPWDWICAIASMLHKSNLHHELLRLGYNFLKGEPLSDNARQLRKLYDFGEGADGDADDDNFAFNHGKESEGIDGLSFTNAIYSLSYRLRKDGDTMYMQPPPLLRVLDMFRGTDATDPRDKVFAFLNIGADARELALVPDYKASVQDVFRNSTEAILKTTKSLSIFSQIQEPCDTRVGGLPGWVPDFSARLPYTLLDTGDDEVPYCVSGPDAEAWFKIHDDDTIEVETIELDVIMTNQRLESDLDDLLINMLKSVLRVPHEYPIGRFEKQRKSDLEKYLGTGAEEPSDGDASGSRTAYEVKPITRIEALWRTLVGDMLLSPMTGFNPDPKRFMTHPAPVSLGQGFCNWIEAGILEIWYLYQNFSHMDKSPEDSGLAGSALRRLRAALSVYSAIFREQHFPLTRDTITLLLEVESLEELAEEERMAEKWSGWAQDTLIFSKIPFFPRVARLKKLLDEPSPSSDLRTYDGDPQSALDGQWRERALRSFTEMEREDIYAFEKRMKAMLKGRSLFTTRSGLLGIGPRSVFQDRGCVYEVHVLKGARVPYVLASYDDGSYRLIGEAYVHGIMNGELLEHMGGLKWCKYQKIRLK